MATWQERRLRLWQDRVETAVELGGAGPPLLFLHGPWGLPGQRDFLDRLAQTHTVYAPRHPGTTPGDPEAVHQLAGWWDLLLYYAELLDQLELDTIALVGHSFGGMVAAELAAMLPTRFTRLVLIDPLGLWQDDRPVRNWMLLPESERRSALFADPTSPAAEHFFTLPDAPATRAEAQAAFIWAQACTGKFVWPIPDRGLKDHTHRISTPTLIVWGQQDTLIDPTYAENFAARITGARIELIDQAGHLPHLEQPERVAGLVRDFLTC